VENLLVEDALPYGPGITMTSMFKILVYHTQIGEDMAPAIEYAVIAFWSSGQYTFTPQAYTAGGRL
jgi:hypothetical protein